jgi:ATP-dependent RNA helicase DDX3X
MKETGLITTFKNETVTAGSQYKTFYEIPNLNPKLEENLKRMQFADMTPIQRSVIPFMSKGSDIMGCAQTGSGKTIAFLLPILCNMLNDGPPETNKRFDRMACPVALILTPTRELAEQIYKESRKITSNTGIYSVKVYGGSPPEPQRAYIIFDKILESCHTVAMYL